MPGRTPAEAFRAFIGPIASAVGCLGPGKVTPSPGGSSRADCTHAWTLNSGRGMALKGGWKFEAEMHYRIGLDPAQSAYRVTTEAYRYKLAWLGHDAWRIHWHPVGVSPVVLPHLHLRLEAGDPERPLVSSIEAHLPSGRFAFEDAVEWVIASGAADPARDDWQAVLGRGRDLHLAHRSWAARPPGHGEESPATG